MDRKQVIIFAGTTEGRTISEYLASCKVPVTACVATEYGETLLTENEYLKVHAGRMDQEEIAAFIREKGAELVIDATHPYAAVVSENVAAACEREQVDYVRLIRGSSAESVDQAVLVGSVDEAVEYLKKTEGNILATTGSKELFKYTQIPGFEKRVFARVLSTGEVAAACEKLGFVGKNLICMQGPFSEELNIAMLHQFDCKYLVTKETGKAGGFEEKLHAAKAAGATLVLVGRPPEQKGYSYDEVLEMMRIRFHLAAASVLDVQPTQAKRKVTLVGIGIGTPEGMTVEAAQVIEKADLLVGADRMLAAAADKHKPTFSAYEPRKIGDYLELHPEYQRIVVLLSGDIGFYSGAKRLYEELEQRDFEVDALCGISSVVYFCGKLRTAWEDVCLLSIPWTQCQSGGSSEESS